MKKPIKVAVIGVGHLGKHHARIYSQLSSTELVCVVDVDEKNGKKIAKEFNVPFVNDYKSIIDKVDAVSVVVPTVLHYEITKFFIQHGIHVLVEKPVTNLEEQAADLEKIVANNNVILQVGHIERFNPAWLAVQEKIINPRFIEIHRLAPFKNRSMDVGVVLDLMIHDIDIVLTIVNKKITDIRSSGVAVLGKHEDIVNCRLEFEGGCVANINASRISSKELRKIRIFQPHCYMTLDYKNQSGEYYELKGGKIKQKTIKTSKDEPLKIELTDFIRCVNESATPKVSISHGKLALSAALKILKQIKN
ncbi:MAG: 1-carboxy-3-chloro-3,4-dihydroxycyclohexa-1, 5-diene dehydrogenase [uncultured bacterium]|nr:MAG: 1-carboxy-3-chloro-3,4-dihydroxycyclohexa-1, 5-diene dehydrogenase [uncultured bacterium]